MSIKDVSEMPMNAENVLVLIWRETNKLQISDDLLTLLSNEITKHVQDMIAAFVNDLGDDGEEIEDLANIIKNWKLRMEAT